MIYNAGCYLNHSVYHQRISEILRIRERWAQDDKICGLIGSVTLEKSTSFCRTSRTHKQEYDRENHVWLCILFKGLLEYIISLQQPGGTISIYKSHTSLPCIQVPYGHHNFDLLLTALLIYLFYPGECVGHFGGHIYCFRHHAIYWMVFLAMEMLTKTMGGRGGEK